MTARLFHVSHEEAVTPEDYASELATARAIVEHVESDPHSVVEDDFTRFGKATPWVAQQLGIYSEKLANENQPAVAIRMAAWSVSVAMASADSKRLNANLLTYANILFRFDQHDAARSTYEHILDLPFPLGFEERGGAHLGLANMAVADQQWHDAVSHWEAALGTLGDKLREPARSEMHRAIFPAHRAISDLAGVVHAASLRNTDVRHLLETELGKMTLAAAVRFTTRLRRYGEDDLADWATEAWTAAQHV